MWKPLKRWAKSILTGTEDMTGFLYNSKDRINFNGKTAGDFLAYNDINLYVNRGIAARAQKVSEVEFILKDKKGNVIDDEMNPWLVMLNKPNNLHTGSQFWRLVQKYLDITGSAYILKANPKANELFADKTATQLFILPSQHMKVVLNAAGTDVDHYEYQGMGEAVDYSTDEVIRLYDPDPLMPLRGVSLLASGIRQIEIDNQLNEYQANILKNGGFVDGIFKFKTPLNEESLKRAKASYAEQQAGAKNSGIPLFLGGDADYMRLGLNPVELAYLESKKLTLDDIATLTGVPRPLLARGSSETFSNADAAQAIFLRDTINPLIKNIVSILDWRLIPEEYELSYEDPTPENRDEMRKDLETANTINALTTNEKRAALTELGFEVDALPDEAADQVLIPFSLTPLSTANETSAANTPAAPVNDPAAAKAHTINHPLKDPGVRKAWGAIQLKRLDRRQGEFAKEMRKYFDEQKKRILTHVSTAKRYHVKGLVDEAFNSQLEIKFASKFALPLLRQFLLEAGQNAFELFGSKYTFHLSSGLENWLDQRANLFANEINSTTYDKLKSQFSQSLDAGENREQLIARIQSVYSGFDESRARTIARTEVHGAVQQGTTDGYKQMGIGIKIWVWAAGVNGGTREEHQAMDGEERPIDTPFSNGLMYPGDPSGDASETVNCECTI